MELAALEQWLAAKVAAELDMAPDEVDRDEVFAAFGLDSMKTVALAGDLEKLLGRRLEPTLLWDYPTIAKLAAHLAEGP